MSEEKCAYTVEFGQLTEILNVSMNKAVGEILTAIDAAMPEGSSQTAVKSLIKQSLWRHNDRVKEGLELTNKVEVEREK